MATISRNILEKTVIASLSVLIFVFSLNKIRNWDIWWHLQAGEYIVNNGTIPRSDPFSCTSTNAPWVDLHWGFQVLSHAVYNTLGGTGIILLKSFLVLATLLLVFKTYTAKNCRFSGFLA